MRAQGDDDAAVDAARDADDRAPAAEPAADRVADEVVDALELAFRIEALEVGERIRRHAPSARSR